MGKTNVAVYSRKKNCTLVETCDKCGVELKYVRFHKLSALSVEDMAYEKGYGNIKLCPLCWFKFQQFMLNNESYTMRASHDFNLNTVEYMKSHGMMEDENIYSLLSKKRSDELEAESEVSESSAEAESN